MSARSRGCSTGWARAGEQEAIRACLATVEAAAEEARSRAAEVSRLYTAVGLLVGLAVAVLLI